MVLDNHHGDGRFAICVLPRTVFNKCSSRPTKSASSDRRTSAIAAGSASGSACGLHSGRACGDRRGRLRGGGAAEARGTGSHEQLAASVVGESTFWTMFASSCPNCGASAPRITRHVCDDARRRCYELFKIRSEAESSTASSHAGSPLRTDAFVVYYAKRERRRLREVQLRICDDPTSDTQFDAEGVGGSCGTGATES